MDHLILGAVKSVMDDDESKVKVRTQVHQVVSLLFAPSWLYKMFLVVNVSGGREGGREGGRVRKRERGGGREKREGEGCDKDLGVATQHWLAVVSPRTLLWSMLGCPLTC